MNPPSNQIQSQVCGCTYQTSKYSDLQVQSDLADGSTAIVSQQNVKFSDAGMGETLSAPGISFRPDCDTGSKLGDFLSRPVAISSFSWAEGSTTAVQLQFNPWELYFNNALIKNKISNFARLRCKLRLKFVVNASPFYFGAMRVCYTPISNSNLDAYESAGAQIKLSQLPGGYIYPADMTSFEMELPFLWPHAWLEVGTLSEFTAMGRVQYILYSKLRSANGSTSTNVNITCYAWAEDVELAGLTSGLALQSDEYEQEGKISGPATAVANVAGMLSNAPVIGPLAMATQVGAQAVSSIASLFGFSNPPVISDVQAYQPKSFHAFANVETSLPLDKLSVDPKNEVTIDREVVGANPDDELVLTNFCGKKSFVFGTLWTDAYAPGTQLMRIPVTPNNWQSVAATGQGYINETPASHATKLFRYWRGSMVYTLKFVKSRYHTGRVQVSWDPQGVPGSNSETTTMTRIIDLQVETEVELSIPFKGVDPWLSTQNGTDNWTNSTSGTITYDKNAHNGVIKVTVLNELTGPAASQELDMLLFVHAGSDFRMAVPNELPSYTSLDVQSDIADGAEDTIESWVPAVTVGESVVSLRSLLHRSSLWHSQWLGNPLSAAATYRTKSLYQHVNMIPRFPLDPGFNTKAVNYATAPVAATKAQFQFSPNHPMNWIGNCFAGYKGGIVHHFNIVCNGNVLVDDVRVERDFRTHILDVAPRQAINRFSIATASDEGSGLARSALNTTFNVNRTAQGHRGMSLTNTNTQSALSVVTPQYSRWKFKPAHIWIRDTVNGTTDYDSLKLCVQTRGGMSGTTTDDGWPIVNIFVAAGVDFDLVHFLCVPTYRSFALPAADNTY